MAKCCGNTNGANGRKPEAVLLYTHRACLAHDPGTGHPESPARLRAVLEAISKGEDPDQIAEDWRPALEKFEQQRKSALLYPVR